MSAYLNSNPKIVKIIDFITDIRLIGAVMVIHSLLIETFLGMSYSMYVLPFPMFFWTLGAFIWHFFFHKDREKLLPIAVLGFMLLLEIVAFAARCDLVTLLAFIIDFGLIVFFFCLKEDDCKLLFYLFLIGIDIYDFFCVCSIFDGVKERNGALQGYDSANHILNGISINSNQLAALNFCGILIVIYIISLLQKKNRKIKIPLLIFQALLYLAFIIASHSRWCIVSLVFFGFLSLIFIPFWKIKKKRNAVIYIFSVFFVMLLLITAFVCTELHFNKNGTSFFEIFKNLNSNEGAFSYFFDKWSYGDYNSQQNTSLFELIIKDDRSSIWVNALNLFKNKPIFGVGQGNIRQLFIETYIHPKGIEYSASHPWEYLHNGFIQVLVANGILVFIFFFAGLMIILGKGFKKVLDHHRSRDLISLISILVLMFYNLAECTILIEYRVVSVVFWMFAAILCDRYNIEKEQQNKLT